MNTLLVGQRARSTHIPRQRQPESGRPPSGRIDPLAMLCPVGAVVERRPRVSRLRDLPAGTTVVLVTSGPAARARVRRVAARSQVNLDRGLIAVPAVSSPLAFVDDAESSVRYFWNHLATVPPGLSRLYPLACLLLVLARKLPWSWHGGLALGYVAIGVRR